MFQGLALAQRGWVVPVGLDAKKRSDGIGTVLTDMWEAGPWCSVRLYTLPIMRNLDSSGIGTNSSPTNTHDTMGDYGKLHPSNSAICLLAMGR